MASWRVARSLDALLNQLNTLAPKRNRASDGAIGDAAHQAQGSASDHNAWFKLGGENLVTARDFTHDPANGLDCHKLAAALIASRDPRIKYLIWQGRICDSRPQFSPWQWKPSSGHYQHLHLSVMATASADDGRAWALPGLTNDKPVEDNMPSTSEVLWGLANFRILREGRSLFDAAEQILLNQAAHGATLAAIANDQDITPAELDRIVNEAVAKHKLQPAEVVAQLVPVVEDIAERVAHADNVEQAAEVVRQLGRQLAGTNTQEV